MLRLPIVVAGLAAGLGLLACVAPPGAGSPGGARAGGAALEFPTTDPAAWINSAPLTLAGLRGEVVLIDVFTYG